MSVDTLTIYNYYTIVTAKLHELFCCCKVINGFKDLRRIMNDKITYHQNMHVIYHLHNLPTYPAVKSIFHGKGIKFMYIVLILHGQNFIKSGLFEHQPIVPDFKVLSCMCSSNLLNDENISVFVKSLIVNF